MADEVMNAAEAKQKTSEAAAARVLADIAIVEADIATAVILGKYAATVDNLYAAHRLVDYFRNKGFKADTANGYDTRLTVSWY